MAKTKITLRQLDWIITGREWLNSGQASDRIDERTIILDANAMWRLMIRDDLWPSETGDDDDKYYVWDKNQKKTLHSDPLIAAKLAYCKLHFSELEIGLVESI